MPQYAFVDWSNWSLISHFSNFSVASFLLVAPETLHMVRVSIGLPCRPGWPGTYFAAQTGFRLADFYVSGTLHSLGELIPFFFHPLSSILSILLNSFKNTLCEHIGAVPVVARRGR